MSRTVSAFRNASAADGPAWPDDGTLLYLSASAVRTSMPDVDTRLALAKQALIGLASSQASELPPKIALHPSVAGSFLHAMPAVLYDREQPANELVGLKWIAGFPGNRSRSLPAVTATLVLNSGETGLPVLICDATEITAVRTAAVTGVAIQQFRPTNGAMVRNVAVIGAGVQGAAHLPILGRVLPGCAVTIFDRHPDRAVRLANGAATVPGIANARAADSPIAATRDADVIITAASFGPKGQVMALDWLKPDALLIAVDYATYCSATVVSAAGTFATDHIGQFRAAHDAGLFEGWPVPQTTIGAAVQSGPREYGHLTVVVHLGAGLVDLVFAYAIARAAARQGRGLVLAR